MKKSILFVLAAATPLAAQNPRPSVQVDTTTVGTAVAPNAASFGGLSVITYNDNAFNEIYAVSSDADGLAWGAPVRVDRDVTLAAKFVGFQGGNETVAISGSHVYVTWRDDRNGAFDDVYFNRSTDGGASFEASDQRLDNSSLPGVSSVRDWSMSVSRDSGGDPTLDRIHVLMSVEVVAGGSEDLFLVTSTDGGASFGSAVAVSTANGTGADVDDLSICSSGSFVYCTWVDNRLVRDDQYVRVSADGGSSFAAEIPINLLPGGGNTGESVDAACDATGLVVVSFGDIMSSGNEVWAAVSTDFGATWGTAARVGNWTSGVDDTDNAQVTISGTNLVATWEDDRTGSDEIYASYSSDFGVTWQPDTAITTGAGGFPRISKDGGSNIVITWTGGAFPEDSLGAVSIDSGVTFTSLPAAISDTTGDSDFTEVAYNATNDNVIVSWLSDDSGSNRVYAGGFSMCNPATVVNRSGGTNPDVYVANAAVLGGTLTVTVDASLTGHSLTALVGFLSPLTFTLGGGQVLLVNIADPSGEIFGFVPQAGPLATYTTTVPNDPGLCALTVYSQGLLVGAVTPYALTNTQDFTIGAF